MRTLYNNDSSLYALKYTSFINLQTGIVHCTYIKAAVFVGNDASQYTPTFLFQTLSKCFQRQTRLSLNKARSSRFLLALKNHQSSYVLVIIFEL